MEEIFEGEEKEIRQIINIAKEDRDIKELLLKQIATEFTDEAEEIVFQEKIKKIINEAKQDAGKMNILIDTILNDQEIYAILDNHFYNYFVEIGVIREAI